MPRRLRGYRCKMWYWRNENGEVYASRHTCRRGGVAIRFCGMASAVSETCRAPPSGVVLER